jgi:hypothetical protein
MGLREKILSKKSQWDLDETGEGARSKIAEYQQSYASFQGIVLEAPVGAEAFAKQVRAMVGALGQAFCVPPKRALVLLPPTLDRKTIAHRLSASLAAEVLSCFEADTADKALELIQPYL